jgi:hypothetical protein
LFECFGQVAAVGAQRQVEDLGGGFLGGSGAEVGAAQDGLELFAFGLVGEVRDGVFDRGSQLVGVGSVGCGGQRGVEEWVGDELVGPVQGL